MVTNTHIEIAEIVGCEHIVGKIIDNKIMQLCFVHSILFSSYNSVHKVTKSFLNESKCMYIGMEHS